MTPPATRSTAPARLEAESTVLRELVAWWPLVLALGLSFFGHLAVVLGWPTRQHAPIAVPLVFDLAVAVEPVVATPEPPAPEPAPIEPAPVEPAPVEPAPRRPRTPRSQPEAPEAPVEPVPNAPPPVLTAAPGDGTPGDVVAPPGPAQTGAPVVPASTTSGPSQAEGPPGPSRAEREAIARTYFAEVRSRIAREKRYPRSARRLGIEGTIRVRLAIARDGSIASLRADGEASVLREAALEAVRAAGPFRPPPAALGPRVSVDVPLVYVLEGE